MQRNLTKTLSLTFWVAFCVLILGSFSYAGAEPQSFPQVDIQIGETKLGSDGSLTAGIKIALLLTLISFAPALILTMTSFTRIAVVLGMTRTAIGTQSAPPNMVITGLALFLTAAIMGPVFERSYQEGIRPFTEGTMDGGEAMDKAMAPLKQFLAINTREKDIGLFLEITKTKTPESAKDVPLQVIVPAFVLSELNAAFQIGFLIALPFLVLDMVVSSVLTAMSMITLPPVVISLPLKLMLFVIVDGWHLIISSLVKTYKIA
jgi:flagellar biosynthesis protein FliP